MNNQNNLTYSAILNKFSQLKEELRYAGFCQSAMSISHYIPWGIWQNQGNNFFPIEEIPTKLFQILRNLHKTLAEQSNEYYTILKILEDLLSLQDVANETVRTDSSMLYNNARQYTQRRENPAKLANYSQSMYNQDNYRQENPAKFANSSQSMYEQEAYNEYNSQQQEIVIAQNQPYENTNHYYSHQASDTRDYTPCIEEQESYTQRQTMYNRQQNMHSNAPMQPYLVEQSAPMKFNSYNTRQTSYDNPGVFPETKTRVTAPTPPTRSYIEEKTEKIPMRQYLQPDPPMYNTNAQDSETVANNDSVYNTTLTPNTRTCSPNKRMNQATRAIMPSYLPQFNMSTNTQTCVERRLSTETRSSLSSYIAPENNQSIYAQLPLKDMHKSETISLDEDWDDSDNEIVIREGNIPEKSQEDVDDPQDTYEEVAEIEFKSPMHSEVSSNTKRYVKSQDRVTSKWKLENLPNSTTQKEVRKTRLEIALKNALFCINQNPTSEYNVLHDNFQILSQYLKQISDVSDTSLQLQLRKIANQLDNFLSLPIVDLEHKKVLEKLQDTIKQCII